jgi:chromosome segregation ATPase
VQGLTAAADTLDQMQSMEETALATEQRVSAAQAALTALQAQIADADRELVDTRTKGAASVKDAAKRAQEKTDAMVAAAEMQATNIVDAARAKATEIVAPAQGQYDTLIVQVTSLGDQLVRMTEDRASLAAAIAAASDDLAAVEGKLAAARDAVAKMLG